MKKKTKIAAVLSWFFPLGLIWYFLDDSLKKDKFVSYHVKQSATLFLFLISVVVLATLIALLLTVLRQIVIIIGLLFVLLLFFIGLYTAFSGKKKPLPIIGFIGEKFDL